MQYVKKPVPIHAQQIINGEPFESWLQPYGESGELFLKVGSGEDGKWWMKTKHGIVSADTGDWILQAADGEIYPCSDEVFRATYAPAETPALLERAQAWLAAIVEGADIDPDDTTIGVKIMGADGAVRVLEQRTLASFQAELAEALGSPIVVSKG